MIKIIPTLVRADWSQRESLVNRPLLSLDLPSLPWVGYGIETQGTTRFVSVEQAEEGHLSLEEIEQLAFRNLEEHLRGDDFQPTTETVAGEGTRATFRVAGDLALSGCALLSTFLGHFHEELQTPRLMIGLPTRDVLLVGRDPFRIADLVKESLDAWSGGAPAVSGHVFRSDEGVISDVSVIQDLTLPE